MLSWHLSWGCVWVYIVRYYEADTPLKSLYKVEGIDVAGSNLELNVFLTNYYFKT